MYSSSAQSHGPDSGSDAAKENSTNLSAIQAALHQGSQSAANEAHKTRIRRRNRIITSCLECRRRKLKCDKQAPCTNCTRFRRDCLYLAPSLDPQAQQKIAEIKDKMGALEEGLEREVVGRSASPTHAAGTSTAKAKIPELNVPQSAEGDEENYEENHLEPSPLAAMDNVYDEDADDDMMDLGVQMGKMRISERVGGWIRPKLVEELTDTLEDVTVGKSRWPGLQVHQNGSGSQSGGKHPRLQAIPKSYIGPGPEYIAPASSFFFAGTNMSANLIDYLPSRTAADRLIAHYFRAVHYMCRCVHRPTFEAQYTLFWNQISTGTEPIPPLQAIIFAAMFSAAVSMTNEQVMSRFGTSKDMLVDSLRTGTESSLAKANFLRTTKVDTMQAFIMYLIPLARSEVSRGHSGLVGTAIRLAECMGLHRDGTLYSMKPVEVHVRRMLWHQLCFLDLRTCEAAGPRPQIRQSDYDTKLPLNVDDVDLLSLTPPTEDKKVWTDMTFSLMRFEYQEMRHQTWFSIQAIDKKKVSLTSVVVKIQRFIQSQEEKWNPMINTSDPMQFLAKKLLQIACNGMHLQVLHRYLFSTTQKMPDRLRQLLIEAALDQMEVCVSWEQNLDMQDWVWYRGAVNQYHGALLLLIEVYAYPMRKEAGRIWKCLDFVFDIPSHLTPKQKAELVLTDLRDRMEQYHHMRKLRVSNQMEKMVGVGASQNKAPIVSLWIVVLFTPWPLVLTFFSQWSVVDSLGQMKQTDMPTNPQAPADTSPPSSNFAQSNAGSADVHMSTMDDIDWVSVLELAMSIEPLMLSI